MEISISRGAPDRPAARGTDDAEIPQNVELAGLGGGEQSAFMVDFFLIEPIEPSELIHASLNAKPSVRGSRPVPGDLVLVQPLDVLKILGRSAIRILQVLADSKLGSHHNGALWVGVESNFVYNFARDSHLCVVQVKSVTLLGSVVSSTNAFYTTAFVLIIDWANQYHQRDRPQ